jgi:hypothetical protein
MQEWKDLGKKAGSVHKGARLMLWTGGHDC